jgi:3-oxoacyl-[acyl-carrier protein] reductase
MNLNEAKIIITGGSSGIGYETAKTLKALGASVLITGRNEERLTNAAKELDLFYFKADAANENEVKALFDYAVNKLGGLNVLINNAGVGHFASLTETSVAHFQKQWEVNTKGVFLAGREAAKHFITAKYGNIINIGSTAAVRGFESGTGYAASKFAVSGMTESWRAELRPYNIRVAQVNPSEVFTDFIQRTGLERKNTEYKLKAKHIAQAIVSVLSLDDIGFIPSLEVWSTNPNRN